MQEELRLLRGQNTKLVDMLQAATVNQPTGASSSQNPFTTHAQSPVRHQRRDARSGCRSPSDRDHKETAQPSLGLPRVVHDPNPADHRVPPPNTPQDEKAHWSPSSPKTQRHDDSGASQEPASDPEGWQQGLRVPLKSEDDVFGTPSRSPHQEKRRRLTKGTKHVQLREAVFPRCWLHPLLRNKTKMKLRLYFGVSFVAVLSSMAHLRSLVDSGSDSE